MLARERFQRLNRACNQCSACAQFARAQASGDGASNMFRTDSHMRSGNRTGVSLCSSAVASRASFWASPRASSPTAPLSLSDSYEILRQVVREATGPNRPSTGPAAVKNRLVRRLGAFDEHAFGFGNFKDYLLAAERAGVVKIEQVGNTARVSLPTE